MPKVLLIYPSQLYVPFWGERTNVKPHMLSIFSFLRHNNIGVEVLDLENEIGRPNILLIFNHPGETLATYNRSIGFYSSMISKQNKISGFLVAQDYAYFPGSQIHRSYNYYKEKYGTVVVFKEWWNERGNHYQRARTIIPSRELSKQPGGRVDWVKTIKDINRQSFEKMPVKARSYWEKRSETVKQL